MADKNILEQMLESLVNDDQAKAEELFHEYCVAKSREIYESLIEDDLKDEEVEESADEDKEEDEEEVKESSDEESDDEAVDENFEDIAIEADDEMDAMGGDATDDLAGELDAEEGDEEGEESPSELFQDLEAIVDELQAKFDELKGGEEMGDEGEEEEEMKDAFEPELETVREYVEKVPAGHGAEKKGAAEHADNTHSPVAGKNDMGGTTANIAKAQEDTSDKGTAGGLANNKPQEDNAGNINVPGGKAGSAFSKKEPGHGAEKKGAAEKADNTNSLFRGKR